MQKVFFFVFFSPTRSKKIFSMSDVNLDEVFALAKSMALEAGEIIATAWNQPRHVNFKSERDLVTETDEKSESLILSKIRSKFPTHKIVAGYQ